jgi:hypothetical protein
MDPIEITIKVLISVSAEGDVRVGVVKDELDHEASVVKAPGAVVAEPTVVIKHELTFDCKRWFHKVGRKEAETCKGCTIQCYMKGKYKPNASIIP